jgi:hypothetical protein
LPVSYKRPLGIAAGARNELLPANPATFAE